PASHLYVEFGDRDRVVAKVVGWDVYDDVGLLKIDSSQHSLDPVPLGNSGTAEVGEPVAAIGSPLGNEDSLAVGVISAVHRSVSQLIKTGHVAYAYVGITSQDLTPSLAKTLGYSVKQGALVEDVRAGGPGADAGLRGSTHQVDVLGYSGLCTGGDIIVAIDG